MSSTVRPSYSFRQLPLFDVKLVKTVQNVTSPHSLNFIPKSEVTVDGGGTVNLEMAVDATHILWRVGSGVWNKLIELSELKGEPGEGEPGKDGKDGKEVSLTKGITHIEWKLGDGNWISLVPLSELKGNDGVDGIDGIDGINGTDGKEISLQVTQSNMLQQRLGTGAWSDVFNLNNLVPNLSSYIKDTDLSDDFKQVNEEIAIDWSKMPKDAFSATPISGTFTLKPEHSGKYFYATAASDFVITLEAGITEPVTIFQKGNGRADVVGDSGVTLVGINTTDGVGSAIRVSPESSTEYQLVAVKVNVGGLGVYKTVYRDIATSDNIREVEITAFGSEAINVGVGSRLVIDFVKHIAENQTVGISVKYGTHFLNRYAFYGVSSMTPAAPVQSVHVNTHSMMRYVIEFTASRIIMTVNEKNVDTGAQVSNTYFSSQDSFGETDKITGITLTTSSSTAYYVDGTSIRVTQVQ